MVVRRGIDPPDQFLVLLTIVKDRRRHAAEEGKGRDMPVAERLGRLGRVGLDE